MNSRYALVLVSLVILITSGVAEAAGPDSRLSLQCRGPVRNLTAWGILTGRAPRLRYKILSSVDPRLTDIAEQISGQRNRKPNYEDLLQQAKLWMSEVSRFQERKNDLEEAKRRYAERYNIVQNLPGAGKNWPALDVELPFAPSLENGGVDLKIVTPIIKPDIDFKNAYLLPAYVWRWFFSRGEMKNLEQVRDVIEVQWQIRQAVLLYKLRFILNHVSPPSLERLLAESNKDNLDATDKLILDIKTAQDNPDLKPDEWASNYVDRSLTNWVRHVHTSGRVTYFLAAATLGKVWKGIGSAKDWMNRVLSPWQAAILATALTATVIGTYENATAYIGQLHYEWTTTPEQRLQNDWVNYLRYLKVEIADKAKTYDQFYDNFEAYFQEKSSDSGIEIFMDYIRGRRPDMLPKNDAEKALEGAVAQLVEIERILLFGTDPSGKKFFRGASERFPLRTKNADAFDDYAKDRRSGAVTGPTTFDPTWTGRLDGVNNPTNRSFIESWKKEEAEKKAKKK